jgi:hypothetical protein
LIHVFLDDVRPCPEGFVLARTAEECLLLLKECDVGVLSLDYELGPGAPNGFAVVEGMIVNAWYPREIYIHSSSPMGRARMAKALRDAAPPGVTVYDGPMPESVRRAVAAGTWSGSEGDPRPKEPSAAGTIRELAPGTWEPEMERAVPPFALFVHTPLCGTCQAARKMLEVVADMMPAWTVVAANLNFMPGLAERWRIESVPCILALDRRGEWHKWYRIGSVVDLAARFRELAEGGERT